MAENGRRSSWTAGLFFLVLTAAAAAGTLQDRLAQCRRDLAKARAMKAEIEARPDDYEDVPQTLAQLDQAIAKLQADEKRLLKHLRAARPPDTSRKSPAEERASSLEAGRRRAREKRGQGTWNLEPPSALRRLWLGQESRLAETHGVPPLTSDEFCDWAGDQSIAEMIGNAKWWMPSRVANERRYVFDPGDPGRVIDMTHFIAAGRRGRLGQALGLAVEISQWWASKLAPRADWRAKWAGTAMDPQDFYSNALGADFFVRHYDPKGPSLGRQLRLYFRQRGERLK